MSALYALIYLWGMWDPAPHARAQPAGLVNLDAGASYRGAGFARRFAPQVAPRVNTMLIEALGQIAETCCIAATAPTTRPKN